MERFDLLGTPFASSEEAGVLRIASEVDEKNCGCVDAAITPSNLYNLLDCRKANTAYTAGAVVACPYHKEFLLKCTTAGTTSANSIDTKSVTKGSVITDGGVKWTIIASQIIDISISGKTITATFIDGTAKTLTTQDTVSVPSNNVISFTPTRGGEYTAPANGIVCLRCLRGSKDSGVFYPILLYRETNYMASTFTSDGANAAVWLKVKKGDTVNITWHTGMPSDAQFFGTFIYDESEA